MEQDKQIVLGEDEMQAVTGGLDQGATAGIAAGGGFLGGVTVGAIGQKVYDNKKSLRSEINIERTATQNHLVDRARASALAEVERAEKATADAAKKGWHILR